MALTLIACQPQQAQLQPQAKVASGFQKVSNEETITSEYLISANGIGKAKLGMTLGQLKKIVDRNTEFNLVSTFVNDRNAIAVSKQGLIQYYILFDADSNEAKLNPTDNSLIVSLVTNNYNYQTEQGVKVGMPIKEAENICGNAILFHNLNGTGEYIAFKNYDLDTIRFRASSLKSLSNGLGFSGIYTQYPSVAYTTDKYNKGAAIAAIEISCNKDACQ